MKRHQAYETCALRNATELDLEQYIRNIDRDMADADKHCHRQGRCTYKQRDGNDQYCTYQPAYGPDRDGR